MKLRRIKACNTGVKLTARNSLVGVFLSIYLIVYNPWLTLKKVKSLGVGLVEKNFSRY